MPFNRDDLRAVSSILKTSENKDVYIQGRFNDLFLYLIEEDIPKKYKSLNYYVEIISLDLFSMETIFLKLMWEKLCWKQNLIGDATWIQFAQIDVDYFHVEFRSCFDHIASAINGLPSSHSSPKSFSNLQKWCFKQDTSNNIDVRINNLVKSCNWFSEIKNLRDSTVHECGTTFIYPDKNSDWTLFQTYKREKAQILIPEIMNSQNAVIFELYASLYFSYLLVFLERLSEIMGTFLGIKFGRGGQTYHPGLTFFNKWVNELLLR